MRQDVLTSRRPAGTEPEAVIREARRRQRRRRLVIGLAVSAVVSDFEEQVGSPEGDARRLVAFLVGTIGNLLPAQRATFLASLRARLRPATFAVWNCPAAQLPVPWPEVRRRIIAVAPAAPGRRDST